MQERFKASPQYAQKIAQVRALSAEGKNPDEAREQAKLLRMKFLLDNAKCAQLLTEFIEKNPRASIKDFDKYAVSTGLISRPEVAQIFIDQLKSERNRISRAKQEIKSKSKKGFEGELVFSWMTGKRKPKHKTELYLGYPLAIILYLEDEDFLACDKREIAGYYDNSQEYYRNRGKKTTYDSFPIILIKGLYSPYDDVEGDYNDSISSVVRHEMGHAKNRSFKNSLESAERKTVWLRKISDRSINGGMEIAESVRRLESKSGSDLESAEKTQDWEIVWNAALSSAKDELLAEIEGRWEVSQHKKDTMKKQKGIYDYFLNSGVEFGSKLYNALWKDYRNILEAANKVIEKINTGYKYFGLTLRNKIEIFRWVLAQIPIQDWPKQIEEALFYEEIEELKELSELFWKEVYTKENSGEKSPKSLSASKFEKELLAKPNNEPLLPMIREFKRDLAKLEK